MFSHQYQFLEVAFLSTDFEASLEKQIFAKSSKNITLKKNADPCFKLKPYEIKYFCTLAFSF